MRFPKFSTLAIAVILPCMPIPAAATGVMALAQDASGGGSGSAVFDQEIAATKAAMMTDPQRALDLSTAALKTADALPDSERKQIAIATAEWLQGEALIG